MHNLAIWAFAAQLLVSGSQAQNSSSPTGTCSDIEDAVRFNASTTRKIQAYKFEVLGTTRYRIVKDDDKTWDLSLRTTKMTAPQNATALDDNGPNWEQTMFLDTGDSDMDLIGSCHQTLQSAVSEGRFEWTREAMERGLEDNGDCTTLLSKECLDALKKPGMGFPSIQRSAKCSELNTTMPDECTGGLTRSRRNRQMNTTYFNGVKENNPNSRFDPSLECNGINASSTHSLSVAGAMSYDNAVRFPVLDVIYFWPNRSSLKETWTNTQETDVRVEVVCMRPDEKIEPGSRIPPSGKDLIGDEKAKFPTASGATALTYGILGWVSAAVMGVMLLL